MGEFPSGQRGQTVNLLRIASMVRIRPPPPEKDQSLRIGLFLRLATDTNSFICGADEHLGEGLTESHLYYAPYKVKRKLNRPPLLFLIIISRRQDLFCASAAAQNIT